MCVCITLQSYYSPGDFLLSLKLFWGCLMCCFFFLFFWVGVFYAGKSLQSNPGPDILLDPWTQFMHGVEGIFCLHGGMQSQADLVPSSLNSCVAKREGHAFIKLSSPLKTIPLHFFRDILYFTYLSLTFTGHCRLFGPYSPCNLLLFMFAALRSYFKAL